MKSMFNRIVHHGILAASLLASTFTLSPAFAAPAGMVSTQQLLQESRAAQQRAQVGAFLDRAEVQAQLEARGVSASDASARIASMSASELASLSAHIDALPAGEGALESLVFILVIFMLLDIAGVTDIFPGI